MFSGSCRVAFGATLIGLLVQPVDAQEETDGQFIEEIVVISKREQTLQEVPVAVSVVQEETLERAQVRDIKDLQSLVPSLRVTQLQTTGNTNFLIRGFGNGANNAGIEPSVGVFIDGVYRSRTASALNDLPKLERIEVARGPQSTLFGKNASAGVINIVTAKPDLDNLSGSTTFTVGSDSQYVVKGDVTGPLSDTVAFSLYGNYRSRDGYFTNLADGTEINEWDRWGVRGQLLFVPSDNLEIRVIADADKLDEFCCGVANLVDGPTGTAIRLVGGNLVPNQPFAYENYYDFNPVNELENTGISAQIDYDFAGLTLTSISAFRAQDRFENSDIDFTSARLISQDSGNRLDQTIDTLTQELRLAGSTERTDWLLGLFYFDEEIEKDSALLYGDAFRPYGDILATLGAGGIPGVDPSPLSLLEAALGFPPGTFLAEGQGNVETAGQDNQAISVFGQVDFQLTDRATLTLGANYTRDEKDAYQRIDSLDVFSGLDLVSIGGGFIFQNLTGLPPTPDNIAAAPVAWATAQQLSTVECSPATGPACNQLLALQPLQFLPPFVDFPNAVESGSSEDSETTWTARLAYDLTDNVNIYAGAGTGFKATSWNLSRDSRPFASDIAALEAAGLAVNNLTAGTRYAGPEESTVYEIGLKARFARGALNVAIFDQEIEGFQSNIFTGTGFSLANAGKQSTTGVELDATWTPVDALNLSFSGTWLDPEYDSFENANGIDGPTDLSGTQPAGIHEFSMNASATYNFTLFSADSFIRAEYIYEDEVPVIENVPAEIASREVSTLNASAGARWGNGLEVILWGRNITDDEYLITAFPSVAQEGSYSGYPNEPRSYGITFRKHFE